MDLSGWFGPKALGVEVTGVQHDEGGPGPIGADDMINCTRDDFAERVRRYDLILDPAGNRPLTGVYAIAAKLALRLRVVQWRAAALEEE